MYAVKTVSMPAVNRSYLYFKQKLLPLLNLLHINTILKNHNDDIFLRNGNNRY